MPSEWTVQERNEEHEFFVRARLGSNDCYIEYEVKTLIYCDDGLKFEMAVGSRFEGTDDPDKGIPLVNGTVKWDGCSHNNFASYIHGCSKKEMMRLGVIFERVFAAAATLMPDHRENLI